MAVYSFFISYFYTDVSSTAISSPRCTVSPCSTDTFRTVPVTKKERSAYLPGSSLPTTETVSRISPLVAGSLTHSAFGGREFHQYHTPTTPRTKMNSITIFFFPPDIFFHILPIQRRFGCFKAASIALFASASAKVFRSRGTCTNTTSPKSSVRFHTSRNNGCNFAFSILYS